MFQPGQAIIYNNCGVCRVEAIEPMQCGVAAPDRVYYTLRPLFGTEVIYAPVDTRVFMRPIMTREQAQALIDQIPLIHEDVCMDRNPNLLRERYEASFQSHDCQALIQLIKSVHIKDQRMQAQGKKLSQVDQKYKKRAEDLLQGELAVVLGIAPDAVEDYIRAAVDAPAQNPAK